MTKQSEVKSNDRSINAVSQSGDEISLIDIFNFMKEGRILLFATTAVGFFGGVGYAFYQPSVYKASAYIQMAKIADKVIESPEFLIEKLKLPLFFSEKVIKDCNIEKLEEPGVYLSKNLKSNVSASTSFVMLSIEAKSTKDAGQCLTGVVELIALDQNAIANKLIASKNNQLAALKQQFENLEKLRKQLDLKYLLLKSAGDQTTAQLIYTVILVKDNETKELEKRISELQVSMQEPQTYPTRLVTPVFASVNRVSPNRTLITGVATLAGLFFGIVLLMRRVGMKRLRIIGADGRSQQ